MAPTEDNLVFWLRLELNRADLVIRQVLKAMTPAPFESKGNFCERRQADLQENRLKVCRAIHIIQVIRVLGIQNGVFTEAEFQQLKKEAMSELDEGVSPMRQAASKVLERGEHLYKELLGQVNVLVEEKASHSMIADL